MSFTDHHSHHTTLRPRLWRRLFLVAFLAGAIIAWFVSPVTFGATAGRSSPHGLQPASSRVLSRAGGR